MEVEKDRPEKQIMTFDEMSVDKSKSFVTALQVNLLFIFSFG